MGDTLIPKFMFLVADKGANVCFVFLLITTASRTTSRAQILLFSNWALHLGLKKNPRMVSSWKPSSHGAKHLKGYCRTLRNVVSAG